ncbi:protein of unknown function [Methylocaldum szegediense]|uniref:Uncharacterized protein n=1 Tax=Methylocaldum szegediense TaxID=73780 RepID=A0ABM9HXY6_9GAMM|nr:protein of unknown function [Methylocaldum szegediense]
MRLALRAVLRTFPFVPDESVHGKAARRMPEKDVRHEPHRSRPRTMRFASLSASYADNL